MKSSVSSRGQAMFQFLIKVDLHDRDRIHLDRDAAQFTVALDSVAIAKIEIRIFMVHRKIDDCPGSHIRQVHVAAVVVRLQ
jgi:hypothetical protein